MKTSMMLVALGSFAAGATLALTASEGLASPARADKPSVYSDGRYGCSLTPPAFARGEKDSSGMAASFSGFPKNGFAPNVNVMIQNVSMTLEEYRGISVGQFKQMDLTVLSETRKKVSGKDAIVWEYEGRLQGRALKWMALAVSDVDRIFLITATALKADYDPVAKEFTACLESFKLGE